MEWTPAHVVQTRWILDEAHTGSNEVHYPIPGWLNHLQRDLNSLETDADFPDLRYVPLAPSSSAFNRSVRAVCQVIPIGEVRTYGEVARDAGFPKAAQAVGQCMARNPFPLLVPCHRVVGSTAGSWWNYSGGGRPVKEWLLKREGVAIPDEAQGLHPEAHPQMVLL